MINMSNEREKEKPLVPTTNKYHETNDGTFDHNSPRPPVPGEEQAHCNTDKFPTHTPIDWKLTSTIPKNFSSYQNDNDFRCASSTAAVSVPLPPACLRWARSLQCLLEDPDGVELFRRYLESEGRQHADALDFWFACEGLQKQDEPERLQQLVRLIYKRFFLKSSLPISDELRREVGKNVKASTSFTPPIVLFDKAQEQIERLISNTTYPNFLRSDMYLHHVQSVQNPSSGSGEYSSESSSSSSTRDIPNLASGLGPLPTLHEDMEFTTSTSLPLNHTPGTGCMSTGYQTPTIGGPMRLTKDTLLVTQNHRALDVRPKPEAFAGLFMYRGVGAHAAYSSYNPVSRQDSEMQSVSSHSDVRTESDNMSLTDSSVDGRSIGRTNRRKQVLEARHARESAALNKETHQTLIPRTQRVDSRQCQPMAPSHFAAILTEKLENVRREQEAQDLLNKKLSGEIELQIQSRELANAIREKLQLEDDNDQDILDQHVSRVFSDQTPARSPGFGSPRPHSPTRNRWTSGGYVRPRRKDKDGFSTFSSDSGNVHDYAESLDHKSSMVKSKSMPEYADDRFVRGSASRRSSSKKTLTDLTDSGVSVVSDTPPVVVSGKDPNRVLAWLHESDRTTKSAYTHSEMSVKHRNHRAGSATSPNASRHRKGYGSRSSSLERSSCSNTVVPAQPFVQDPRMPPLPIPNTAMQLEEARRRLEDDMRPKCRQRNKHYYELIQSGQSTLRKSARGQQRAGMPPAEEVTTVVFSFCDENVPYRTKIPGAQVTLGRFKEYLPKKGNYRFFFKTVCKDLDNQVIHEEVRDDRDVLPLWDGKIMGQVMSVD